MQTHCGPALCGGEEEIDTTYKLLLLSTVYCGSIHTVQSKCNAADSTQQTTQQTAMHVSTLLLFILLLLMPLFLSCSLFCSASYPSSSSPAPPSPVCSKVWGNVRHPLW